MAATKTPAKLSLKRKVDRVRKRLERAIERSERRGIVVRDANWECCPIGLAGGRLGTTKEILGITHNEMWAFISSFDDNPQLFTANHNMYTRAMQKLGASFRAKYIAS